MLVLHVGISCGIGKVALPAAAGEVAALVVLTLPSGVLQSIHFANQLL